MGRGNISTIQMLFSSDEAGKFAGGIFHHYVDEHIHCVQYKLRDEAIF